MQQSVALIGTSHQYQFGGSARSPAQNAAFEALLTATCEAHHAQALAEEMSKDALKLQDRTESSVALLAKRLGLRHVYCDPSEDEQRKMGLRVERNALGLARFDGWTQSRIDEGIATEHRLREQFWYQRLLDRGAWPYVFVCGSEHVLPFRALLLSKGVSIILVAERWDA